MLSTSVREITPRSVFNPSLALELAYIAVEEALRLKASYADVRYEAVWQEDVRLLDARLSGADTGIERGLGVRVLVGGAWGFSAVSEPTRHDVGVAVRRAVEMARAAAVLQERPVRLAEQDAQRGVFRISVDRDPVNVPLDEKVELLTRVSETLQSPEKAVGSQARFHSKRSHKVYVSSEGAEVEQDLIYSGLGFRVATSDGDNYQERSFMGPEGMVQGKGWELVESINLMEQAELLAHEATELLRADACPEGPTDLILGGCQLATHLIWGLGSLLELDRVVGLGPEGRGGTFLMAGDLGSRRLGSPHLNLVSDPAHPEGAGAFGFDDEGVPAERIELITEGRLSGYLSGRETAALVGLERSQGSMRSGSWSEPARVRPSNLILEPGSGGDLEALIADTSHGVLIEGPRGWSVDGWGQSFVATSESAWAIENGKRARRLQNPSYRGGTDRFWTACDAVADASAFHLYGAPGPREPWGEVPLVGAGASAARFRGVEVGTRVPRLVPASRSGPLPYIRGAGGVPLARAQPRGFRRLRRIARTDVK